jgi:hypothetical protein
MASTIGMGKVKELGSSPRKTIGENVSFMEEWGHTCLFSERDKSLKSEGWEMQKTHRPNIAFAGLTAAGKTTHAKILAEQLGYEWISATTLYNGGRKLDRLMR